MPGLCGPGTLPVRIDSAGASTSLAFDRLVSGPPRLHCLLALSGASHCCPVSLCETFLFFFLTQGMEQSLLKPIKQHHTVDHLARGSMKNGASSET